MARMNKSAKQQKNTIQNVRVVDSDEGTDDLRCQRIIQHLSSSEQQIRVLCNFRGELAPGSGGAASSFYDFGTLASTDDFISFAAQFQEFRVRAFRADCYDIQPSSPATINYWATYHSVGNAAPPAGAEDIIDRPDARIIAPGTGKVSLSWVAHGLPEMGFQSITTYTALGGLAVYVSPSTTITGSKYTVVIKFAVDFRGRR